MDNSKKAAFVRKMGKKRLKLAKGGHVKRKYMDMGGLLGPVGGMLGMGGGAGGTGFNPQSGTTPEQITEAYNRNQTALKNQSGIADTLRPQVASGVGAQNTLAGQYAKQAVGAGPNVAQTMLNTETGRNVANQGALMAGQRGAGSNVGLMARQVGQQGAAIQGAAAGNAAQLQAEQQIAAQQAAAQLAANQIGQGMGSQTAATTAEQNEQGILQGANTANNSIQGQLANTREGQQPNAISSMGNMIGPALQGVGDFFGGFGSTVGGGLLAGGSQLLPAVGGAAETVAPVMVANQGGEVKAPHFDFVHKMTKMGLDHHVKMADGGPIYSTGQDYVPPSKRNKPEPDPSPADPSKAKEVQDSFNNSTGLDSVKSALGFADGGKIDVPQVVAPQVAPMAAANNMEPSLPAMSSAPASSSGGSGGGGGGLGGLASMGSTIMDFFSEGGEATPNKGGIVKAMVSPGEEYLNPEQVKQVIENGADPARVGEKIPGKAKVKGDSLKNDTVPKDLKEGGVVVDREHMGSADKRKKFVMKSIAKKKSGSR